LPVLGLSILPLFALIRWSRKWEQGAMLIAIGLLSTALFAAAHWHAQVIGLLLSLWLFFVAFNYMEAALPSRISRIAPASRKGAALGVYSSAQFMGSFVGAMSGGWAMQNFGLSAGFTAAGILTSVWLLVACFEAPRVPVKTTASDLGG
ncbi:MAG: MFS transporter, partial [Panacagrimonas sp.]